MERDEVKRILLFCRDIDGEILMTKRLLQDCEHRYYTLPGGNNLDGMPKSGRTTSPTETAALNIPDFASVAMAELRQKEKRLCELKDAVLRALNELPLPQKVILYDFYLRGLQWVQISARVHYSKTQCKKIRNRALDEMAYSFSRVEIIKNFSYPF